MSGVTESVVSSLLIVNGTSPSRRNYILAVKINQYFQMLIPLPLLLCKRLAWQVNMKHTEVQIMIVNNFPITSVNLSIIPNTMTLLACCTNYICKQD